MHNVYTVKQVNAYVKNMFAQDFMLNRIYVKGEFKISHFRTYLFFLERRVRYDCLCYVCRAA